MFAECYFLGPFLTEVPGVAFMDDADLSAGLLLLVILDDFERPLKDIVCPFR